MPKLKIGQLAPAFAGVDQAGKAISLEALLEHGPVVLYFYPRDFTPVCTAQACGFRDAMSELHSLHHASIVGVSGDDDESHRKFAARWQISFSLLADGDRALARKYGVESFFGLRVRRVTFVIGRDQIIRGVFHHELSAKAHVQDVKALLASEAEGSPRATATPR